MVGHDVKKWGCTSAILIVCAGLYWTYYRYNVAPLNELAGKTYQGTVTEYRDGKPTGEQFVFKVQFDSEGDYLTISGLIGPRHPYPVEFSNAAWFTSDKHHVSISNSSIGDPIQLDIIMGFSVPATRLEITKIILSDKALSYSGSLDLIESE